MDYNIFGEAFSQVQVMPLTTSVGFAILFIVILLFLSGLASGSEIAFFSLSPRDLSELDPSRYRVDSVIEKLRDDSERTLATILIVNNLVNVTIIMLCNYVFAKIVDFGNAFWLQFVFTSVILTFLLLLFGEIMPKVYSRQNSLAFCRRMAPFISGARKLFYPLESMLLSTGRLVDHITDNDGHVISVDELEQALELTDKEELKEEQSILQSIIRFGDETVRDVMTSRQDIVDLEIGSKYDDVIKCVIENNYSRIPVYQGNEDNIRGVLYVKDLLLHLSKGSNFRWQSLIRPPYYVPETKKIDDLLRDFQENKVHIAIVVDEFGGTSGIVTLEDVLEEIVGEINDEFDEEKRPYVEVAPGTYVFEGKTLLTDVTKSLSLDSDEFADAAGEADTIAGLLLELKGDFPKVHEKLEFGKYEFEVLSLDGRRISKVKITQK